jgi:(R,R)-butanediol dehydrogenase/meso-butanediol dehydrogenase/diacetyl reductase
VIEGMARGSYPLEGWVETIPFENLVDLGLERLRRQEGLKILVEMGSKSRQTATGARA